MSFLFLVLSRVGVGERERERERERRDVGRNSYCFVCFDVDLDLLCYEATSTGRTWKVGFELEHG